MNMPALLRASAQIPDRQFREGYDDAKLELAAKIQRHLALQAERDGPLSDLAYAGVVCRVVREWLTEP